MDGLNIGLLHLTGVNILYACKLETAFKTKV